MSELTLEEMQQLAARPSHLGGLRRADAAIVEEADMNQRQAFAVELAEERGQLDELRAKEEGEELLARSVEQLAREGFAVVTLGTGGLNRAARRARKRASSRPRRR